MTWRRTCSRTLAAYLGDRELSAGDRDELWRWRAYRALRSAAGHRAKGEVDREHEQVKFVERMLNERPGALA